MDGFNGKLTEVHAALGLANLKYYNDVLNKRKKLYNYYLEKLKNERIEFQSLISGANFSYFPIILQNEKILLTIEQDLNENNIYPRRYFYPSVNLFNNIVDYSKCEHSENISKKILCLPLYSELKLDDIDRIVNIISKALWG